MRKKELRLIKKSASDEPCKHHFKDLKIGYFFSFTIILIAECFYFLISKRFKIIILPKVFQYSNIPTAAIPILKNLILFLHCPRQ